MSRNPKTSKWSATPKALRKRKPVVFTLSDEAREKLDRLAGGAGQRSAKVEELIMNAPDERPMWSEDLRAAQEKAVEDAIARRAKKK